MTWMTLDDAMLDHPKFIRAVKRGGSEAVHLWLGLRAYCAKHLTDGDVPEDMLDEVRGPSDPKRRRAALEALLADDVGLLERTSTGVRLHDYLQWSESRVQVLAKREKARERKARSRGTASAGREESRRDEQRDGARTDDVHSGVVTNPRARDLPSHPIPSHPDPPNPPSGDAGGSDSKPDLETRATAYLRDEQGERLRHQPAETWPEVRQVLDAFRAAWPKAPAPVIRGGLRDSRLRAVLERLSEGYAPGELARAVKASASDEHYQRHASCQTLSTILGDPARVDRWLAAEPDAPRRDTPEEARLRAANQRRLAKAAAEDEARKRQLEAEGAELRRQHGSPEGAAAVAAAVRMVATAMQERT